MDWRSSAKLDSATANESERRHWRNALLWLPVVCWQRPRRGVILLWSRQNNSSRYFYAQPVYPGVHGDSTGRPHPAAIGKLESGARKRCELYEVGSRAGACRTLKVHFPILVAGRQVFRIFRRGCSKADIAGGPVQIICDAPTGRGGSWNKDSVIIFTPSAN
jgi:hypothetical protein